MFQMLCTTMLLRFALFVTLHAIAPRVSRSQSACVESHAVNATICYWDASNHSVITAPAIVGVTVLPLLHTHRTLLFASLNGGPLIPLFAGAAAIPVPSHDALPNCDIECTTETITPDKVRCCSLVIDVWLVSGRSRMNIGCSLYVTIPIPAAPANLEPIFKFHGEINAGLQVSSPLINHPLLSFLSRGVFPHLFYTAYARNFPTVHVCALHWLVVPRHLHRCWCTSLF